MANFGGYRGWRQLWLVCLGLCVWLVVQVIMTILPSRADVAETYLRRAIEIEKRFDFSLRNMDESQLASRYTGISSDEALMLIRDKLHRAHSGALTQAGSVALHGRNTASSPLTKASGAVLWLDEQSRLTPEAVANLNSELDQLTQHYQKRLAALPAQKRKAIAYGIALVCLPMTLLYLLGVLRARVAEQPRAAVNPAPDSLGPGVNLLHRSDHAAFLSFHCGLLARTGNRKHMTAVWAAQPEEINSSSRNLSTRPDQFPAAAPRRRASAPISTPLAQRRVFAGAMMAKCRRAAAVRASLAVS